MQKHLRKDDSIANGSKGNPLKPFPFYETLEKIRGAKGMTRQIIPSKVNGLTKAPRLKACLTVLGITWPLATLREMDRDVLLSDVKTAFRALMKQHHTDKGGSHEAACALTAAYDRIRELLSPVRVVVPPPRKPYVRQFKTDAELREARRAYGKRGGRRKKIIE